MNDQNLKVLVVDDEEDILEIIRYNLEHAGYLIETARDGDEALEKAAVFLPDLIILDIMMPHKNGFETIKALQKHQQFTHTRIVLTALNDEQTEIKGLNLGADDYITKPIKPQILLSRVKAALRRMNNGDEKMIRVGDLVIDRERFIAVFEGKEIILARKEFELLELLASRPGKVFLRDEILERVWGAEVIVGDRTVDVHIRKIRQKINDELIATIKGVGYKLAI
jgi:two-component system alkaline phosphatase synthesis response regulator PhoP